MRRAALAIVLYIAAAAPASAIPIASYVFDSGALNLPDPSVWSASGNITPIPLSVPGLAGLLISDDPVGDNSLLYRHDFSASLLAGTVSFNAVVQIPPFADSNLFVDDFVGWRMIFDDGVR